MNDYMPKHMTVLLEDAAADKELQLTNMKVAILGFAFLENSDDPRNTPALPLYNNLKERCKEVTVHDPYIKEYEDVELTNDLDEALKDRDAILVVTRHKQYKELPLDHIKQVMRTPIIIDGRNVYDRKEAKEKGFTFRGVGLPRD